MGKKGGDVNDWIILRTKGGKTLALAQSLGRAGLSVWTPIQLTRRRLPKRRAVEEQSAPLLPTYVFARARHIVDLLEAAEDPMSAHPEFSVFHYDGRIPLIADDDLRGLRLSERKSVPPAKQRVFKAGEEVKVSDGPFAGMSGVVEQDGKFVLVAFGRMEVRIARFLLDPGEKMAA